MRIEEPGTVLQLIGAVVLLGTAACVYMFLRFFLGVGRKPKKASPRDQRAEPTRSRGDLLARLRGWLTEPVSSSTPAGAGRSQPSAGQGTGSARSARRQDDEAVEVFRILRVGPLKQLVVEVSGKRYRKLAEIQDGTAGRRVLLALQELGDFVGPYGQQALPEMHRFAQLEVRSVQGKPIPTEAQERFLDELGEPTPPEAAAEPRPGVMDFLRRGVRRPPQGTTEAAEPQLPSMVDEMEVLLQERLARLPDMAGRRIHFRCDSAGELQIEVDGLSYQTPEEVPDPTVATLLRTTIKEWELR